MRPPTLRCALTLTLAPAVLAACAGPVDSARGDAGLPIASPGTTLQSRLARRERGPSWMLPEAKKGNLLYVTDSTTVTVYSYPKGKLVGELTGFGTLGGDCVDKAGDVWIIDDQYGKLYEYAHGGTSPLATLSPQDDPLYCSVDPRSGDLAVGTGEGVLLIYPDAGGAPVSYRDDGIEGFLASAYDRAGNLYVDALTPDYKFAFAELPKGAGALQNVTLDQTFDSPGGVAVIGSDVIVGDADTGGIYAFRISGDAGTEVGSTQLQVGTSSTGAFTIQRSKLIVPIYGAVNAVEYFSYPAGGYATKAITNGVETPAAVALSKAI